MPHDYVIALTTFGSSADADEAAGRLVGKGLAACVQILEIKSVYQWKNKIEKSPEFLLLIKTRKSLYPEVEKDINVNHPYDVPEIIMIPIEDGLPAYLTWMDGVLNM